MDAPALTHHEIIERVEPFTRRGRHVDLPASDRAARRLVFKPIDHPAPAAGGEALRETLSLDCRNPKRLVLERLLRTPGGSTATLQATGADAAELLARIEAVPLARHFSHGSGYAIARSYEWLSGEAAQREGASRAASELFMSRAVARLDALTLSLSLRMPGWRNVAGDFVLTPTGIDRPDLPEDVLAVLGWDWARLLRDKQGWTSKLRLRGRALRRSRTAETAIERAAQHLVRTLALPPAQFHDEHQRARWGVVLRRSIPTLTIVIMIGGALGLLFFADRNKSGLWVAALNYVPPLMLAIAFSLQELPRFEFPPWPRRSRAPSWFAPAAGPAAADATVLTKAARP
jgi:hypothetical protein